MNNTKKTGFHITITDLETGKTLHDTDTGAIIGAFDAPNAGTNSICFTACNTIELLATLMAVDKALNHLYEKEPELLALKEGFEKWKETKINK